LIDGLIGGFYCRVFADGAAAPVCQGTAIFKAGTDFKAAADLYVKAGGWLESASALRESCFNNAALCFLNSKQPVDAIKYASKALADQPANNSKALFRRAQGYVLLRYLFFLFIPGERQRVHCIADKALTEGTSIEQQQQHHRRHHHHHHHHHHH
jgi:hypothetical protein